MKFHDLPPSMQFAINKALSSLDEDFFGEEVWRDGEHLIVEVSGLMSDKVVERIFLGFNHENETYQVKERQLHDERFIKRNDESE